MRRFVRLAIVAASLAGWSPSPAAATTLQPIGSFERPIFVTSDPLDPERLFVVERDGVVVEANRGVVGPYADITSLVACCSGERGLLSIVLAPDFPATGRFYAAYAGEPAAGGQEGDLHVDSFRPAAGGGPPIREPILSIDHSLEANHYGGQLQLGPDGHLYVSTGDGGGSGDPLGSGQDTNSLLGKILRIDPRPGQEPAYGIPPGNPFVAGPGLDEIWAYGLRNPWRFSFDRASGDMIVADVGQDSREEIDYAPSPGGGAVSGAGANYGWNCREGLISYPPSGCSSAGVFTDPVFDYPHEDPGGGAHGCSIIGGYVVRDPGLGELFGRYVYTDFCTAEIRSLALPGMAGGPASGDRSEGLTITDPTSFGEDSCGRIYVASNAGAVYRLAGSASSPCSAVAATPTAAIPIAIPVRRPGRIRLRLFAKHPGPRARIVARAFPCVGLAGAKVQLNRGGEPLAARRLNQRCRARFHARVGRRSTFRAFLRNELALKSRRLVLTSPRADRRQRNQVRTIALAKPRP